MTEVEVGVNVVVVLVVGATVVGEGRPRTTRTRRRAAPTWSSSSTRKTPDGSTAKLNGVIIVEPLGVSSIRYMGWNFSLGIVTVGRATDGDPLRAAPDWTGANSSGAAVVNSSGTAVVSGASVVLGTDVAATLGTVVLARMAGSDNARTLNIL